MTNKLAATKRSTTRTKLISAYEAYQRQEPGSMDALLLLVRSFIYMKLYHLEHDFKDFGSAETVDDWTQDALLRVWQDLPKKKFDTPALFYSWLHKVAFNQEADSVEYLRREKRTKVSLFVDNENENGETYEDDNPLIYADSGGCDAHPGIPANVQGIDRDICILLLTEVQDMRDGEYIMRGRTYAEVGLVLGMTEGAVKSQMQRLRKRLKKERSGALEREAAD